MKKKGFTLIELIAVISIMTVLLTAILGIYVNYAKRSSITKNRTDIQNDFSNSKEKIKNKMKNNNTIILEKKIKISSSAINKDLKSEKAYLEIISKKDNEESEKVSLLVSFINESNKEKELYFIEADEDNLDDEGDVITLNKISSFEEVTANVSSFDIKKFNGGFLFDISFSKNNTKRSYEFLLSEKINELVINSDYKDDDNNEESNLDDFFNSISGITLLNGGNIQVEGSFTFINSSYFVGNLIGNGQGAESQLKDIITSTVGSPVFISNVTNSNKGNIKPQSLPLAFKKGNYISNDYYGSSISEEIYKLSNKRDGAVALLDSDYEYKIYNNYNDITKEDISDSIGAIIRLGYSKYIILINGNLNIEDTLSNGVSMFIYSSGNIRVTRSTNAWIDTSIVCGGNLIIDSPSVYIYSEYKVDDATKKCISKFLTK
ncbi:type II secretion system protein [Clostridium baratii]|uniref:type II secretion system protein n=1 Tax=Clostridium baratii TaxID=1561 RepID=UPI0005F2F128|nr:prepilin-type N-terminal cleavage/methylation domain-containing protein [Clostridium baratii]KJU73005.1 hypothetical protein UC77_03235 [Clostridium baratii]